MEFVHTNINESKQWKDFLISNFNLFFDPLFLDYNVKFKKDINFHHLLILEKNKTQGLITGNIIFEFNKKYFVSCDGVSFGGFLMDKKCRMAHYFEVLKYFFEYLKDNNFDGCIIRNPPSLYQPNLNEEFEYAMLQNGFSLHKYAITNITYLENFTFDKLTNPKKRSINKSSNNINLGILEKNTSNESLKNIYDLLFENRKLKNTTPTHSLEELVYLKNTLPDKIIIFKAEIDNNLCGMCVLFKVTKDVILNFYLAADEKFKKYRVSDYMLFKTIMWAQENGFRFYDIGTSNTGNIFLQGLFDFKKKFMADGFLRKTYSITF